jgi:hypothetical protein
LTGELQLGGGADVPAFGRHEIALSFVQSCEAFLTCLILLFRLQVGAGELID